MRDEHAIESGRSQLRPNSSNLAHLLDTVAVKELLLIGDDNIVYAVEQLNERTHRGSTQPRYLRIGTFGADAAQKHRRHHDVSEGGKSNDEDTFRHSLTLERVTGSDGVAAVSSDPNAPTQIAAASGQAPLIV